MEETPRHDPPAEKESSSGEHTWLNWSGLPVYGVSKNAAPPDFTTPWQFNPQPQQQPITQTAPPVAQPAPDSATNYTEYSTAPQQYAAQAPMAPPPPQYYCEPPSPLGPAKTPDERAQELGIPIPPAEK